MLGGGIRGKGKGGGNLKIRGQESNLNVWMWGRNLKACWDGGREISPQMINDCGLYVVCIPNMVCYVTS